ncbi:hypothetical protein BASA50_000316 [Batrachochytrium salamandrivorans]|uniref:RRM domain-containing protein n=1 Tax=Batrachochytrium salamandrivorans TaxID=1357716 RepID=A0ABQ8EU87_9FUNG|nr:hypothetical protein BASA62_009664 [Batrachochytrium salamandrivorans]KAH6574685.1 hypothetical protein BASA60_005387 [Batrachochytrium salamandrivorans]KAH6586719.1 hypothetical protein BASA50_000316 [Batrachochytrium salamandrivorans]KAH6599215.1 hypothetical protein BASA61_002632 [Batrachochytrium salamandrivorans]KAH9269401.1 hypothetical protein BASA83_008484 [Batrachochytrium salamandrivorans]
MFSILKRSSSQAALRLASTPSAVATLARAPISTSAICLEKRLFIGNLAWSTDEQTLTDLFAVHGEITQCSVARDRETGRARGFGFITYSDDDAALKAIDAMNGVEVGERQIRVSEAIARDGPRPPRNDGGRGGYGGDRGGYGGDRGGDRGGYGGDRGGDRY